MLTSVVATISILCASASRAGETEFGSTVATRRGHITMLHHDPRFILRKVAQRMGITLRPGIPAPMVLLQSKTPLARMRAAAERQWGLQPAVFVTFFASTGNEIYLIDDADIYERRGGTLDDALAHELTHYLQARYRGDTMERDWSESEAVAMQVWFRGEHMQPGLLTMNHHKQK